MTDLERANALGLLLEACGDRWQSCVPIDLQVQGDSIAVGAETIVHCDDGRWRRVVDA